VLYAVGFVSCDTLRIVTARMGFFSDIICSFAEAKIGDIQATPNISVSTK
jgi:hypothetical protein